MIAVSLILYWRIKEDCVMTLNKDTLQIIRCSEVEDLKILKNNYIELQTSDPEYIILRRYTEVQLKRRLRQTTTNMEENC